MTKSSTTGEKNGLKKGPWTPEEDQKLINYIQKHGHGKWRILPKNAGLKRCGKSCRLRWANYLRPDIKRGRFSLEEEEAIIQLHSVLGNKWSTIAANLPGRTDNEIKNYWNTHIKKKLLKMGIDPVTHTPRLDVLQLASILNSYNSPQFNNPDLFGMVNPSQLQLLNLFTTLLSCQSRGPSASNNNNNNNNNYHQNQFGGSGSPLLQNQSQYCSQPTQLDSIQAFQQNQPHLSVQENHCTESDSDPLHMEYSQTKLENQISPVATPFSFSHQNTTLPNFNVNNLLESHQILCNSEGMPSSFNLSSLFSSTTPAASSSSASGLNSPSSTTFVNGTTGDERDTYGSNLLNMYNNVSNGLNDDSLGLL